MVNAGNLLLDYDMVVKNVVLTDNEQTSQMNDSAHVNWLA